MSIKSSIQDSYLQREKDYWVAQLAGGFHPCGLPLDLRPEYAASETEKIVKLIGADVVQKSIEVAGGNDALLFAILLGALKICLHKYTGLDDIVVGSPIHERYKNTAFSNGVLVLRDRVEDAMSARQLLEGIRHTLADAYANQRYPYERLRQLADVNGNQGPLFAVAISLDTIHDSGNILGLGQDVTLQFAGPDKQLAARIHYNPARVRRESCEQFVDQFQQVLWEMLNCPDKTIAPIQLFSDEKKRGLLRQRNPGRKDYLRNGTIMAQFEEQVRSRPTAAAVQYEGRSLTYQELNRAANRLAHYLRKEGAGPEITVGICLERSLEMIVGLLGIVKSGAAYVPIDPDYPPERQQTIVKDSFMRLIITNDSKLEWLPVGVKPVCLAREQAEIGEQSQRNPENRTSADNLAYIMYTSGSTGVPKGVAVPHRGVVRLVKDAGYVHLGADEKILQFAPLSFDASTFDIWGSLLNGGELVVMSAGKASLEELSAAIQENEISTLWLTAGLFHLMVDQCLDGLKGIRQLLAGGDIVSVIHAEKYLQANPEGALIDGYGPTENTTFTCCHNMRAGTEMGSSVPIGKPISRTEVHILDRNFDLVPVGVVGELYAGGDGLARGYVNDPKLTAEKFVPHPLSEVGGERLYRTGDLAKYRWDGAIEFAGRADQQVKIRGFRIELDEIEAVLGKHSDVRASVVMAEASESGEKQLTAYVVVQDGVTTKELTEYLKEKLPEYMVPATLVKISEMPLTGNGKIDRARLAEQKAAAALDNEGQESYAAPRDGLEEVIAEVWKEVLGVERVGIFDNFFDLGGHSLLAMSICKKMNARLECKARVTDVFLYPTVDLLARYLGEKMSSSVAQASGRTA